MTSQATARGDRKNRETGLVIEGSDRAKQSPGQPWVYAKLGPDGSPDVCHLEQTVRQRDTWDAGRAHWPATRPSTRCAHEPLAEVRPHRA